MPVIYDGVRFNRFARETSLLLTLMLGAFIIVLSEILEFKNLFDLTEVKQIYTNCF